MATDARHVNILREREAKTALFKLSEKCAIIAKVCGMRISC